jgi:hypothetical protein
MESLVEQVFAAAFQNQLEMQQQELEKKERELIKQQEVYELEFSSWLTILQDLNAKILGLQQNGCDNLSAHPTAFPSGNGTVMLPTRSGEVAVAPQPQKRQVNLCSFGRESAEDDRPSVHSARSVNTSSSQYLARARSLAIDAKMEAADFQLLQDDMRGWDDRPSVRPAGSVPTSHSSALTFDTKPGPTHTLNTTHSHMHYQPRHKIVDTQLDCTHDQVEPTILNTQHKQYRTFTNENMSRLAAVDFKLT